MKIPVIPAGGFNCPCRDMPSFSGMREPDHFNDRFVNMSTDSSDADWPVVVVDDDPDVPFLLSQLFRSAGISNPVLALADANEAMRTLEELISAAPIGQGRRPLFITVDLKLPRTSGFELLGWLQQRPEFRGVPCIVLSSSVNEKDVARAYELGANGFLTKYPGPTMFATIARYARESHEDRDSSLIAEAPRQRSGVPFAP